jgi:UPF0755 protein
VTHKLAGLVVLICLITFALFGFFWWKNSLLPVGGVSLAAGNQNFTVVVGESGSSILSRLFQVHLIKSVLVARVYLKIHGLDKHLVPGTYVFSSGLSTPQILEDINRGPQDIKITLPEGWRREQIAARLGAALPAVSFRASDFLAGTTSLEGQLFPDTYLIPPTATTTEVITIISRNFAQKVGSLDRQSLILASMVEREAREAVDRPIIAGILKKRLEAGWPLQVDATVQYGRDSAACSSRLTNCDWWGPLVSTQFSTIYNTYLHPGLPPGPICNPGLASIEAARQPAVTPYWYYLTGTDGITRYARDLDEQNRNIDKYLTP